MRRLRRRYGRSGQAHAAELALFERWMSARRRASKGNRKAYHTADKLQYQLQDMSAFGNSLVWGHEGRKRGV